MQRPIDRIEEHLTTWPGLTIVEDMAEHPGTASTPPVSQLLVAAGIAFGVVTMAVIFYAIWSSLQSFPL